MFKLALAQYINDNMVRFDMTYKDLMHKSGIPLSTLHSYSHGKVNNPTDEYCDRIAAAFGDSPDVIRQMRRSAIESTAHENKIIAHADDKELLEQMGGLIRANVLEVLEAYKSSTLEQQDQIIAHADARVLQTEQRCADQIADIRSRCDDKILAQKEHTAAILAAERAHHQEISDRHERASLFLKSCVFYLSTALAVACALLIVVSSYAVYAYHTFDRADPTQGLYRAGAGVNIPLVAVIAFLVFLIVAAVVGAVVRRKQR